MTVLISVLAFVCLATLCLLVIKIRNVVGDLSGAVRSRRRLLSDGSSRLLQWVGLEGLLEETNELIARCNDYAEAQKGRLNQLEAILESIQEAVIIFSQDREIEYANESARQLFRQGEPLNGLRLESVLRSPVLIEYLNAYSDEQSYKQQQVSFERQGTLLWFEMSCTRVREVTEMDGAVTLLVLHDITKLKRLEEVRRDFVANVSHELRTPITIIKGYTETLIDDNELLTAERRARFLEKIEKNTQRLHVLVEDLLVLSRLESKPHQVNYSVESLKELLDEILENYHSRLDTGKQKITLIFDRQVREFAFDRFRIQQVFDNLIENVFNYAPDFTELKVEVGYDEASDAVQCSVTDDGPGIPEKDLPHVFERFYRVDKGRSYEGGGSGLGLSIMKHIVQQHGGNVFAESRLGDGTSIRFSLPYMQTVPAPSGPSDEPLSTLAPETL